MKERRRKQRKKAPAKKAPEPAPEPTQAEINEYPTLIDSLIDKMKKLLKKIEQENNKFLGLPPVFSNKKEKKKFDLSKKKLTEELDKLNKEGRDRFGNLYLKEASVYFKAKYGENWAVSHPTASKEIYFNADEKLYDPLYDKAKEILDNFGYEERGMSGKGMSGEGKHNEEEDERLDMKISDMAKKVSKIEKEHEKMTGKGKHDAPTIMPVTTMPVAGSEPKPVLGRDPATWSPVVSAPRPDFERGHNVPLRAGRYDGVSGSKLLGSRHQAFSSQPHSVNYGWKHSLGMPR
jgi:hypothetical protein